MKAFIFIGCALLWCVRAQDYCSPGLCPPGTVHIGCNNNGNYGEACPSDAAIVDMTDALRQVILDAHNERRNRVAKGLVPGFEAAVRMPVMQWSGELSYLAELKAKQCLFAHDQCHNTVRFKQTGQNMAYLMDWGKYGEVAPTIGRFMKMWFEEYKTADMGIISQFRFADDPVNQPHSHFTELVSDRCKHVGCALIHFTDKNNSNLKVSQLVCNYSFTNILGEPIYKTGSTGENCATGLSKRWDGLCSKNEAVTPYATGRYGNW